MIKQVSFWAKENKHSARFIILISYIILNLLGLFVGDILYSLHVEFSPFLLFLAIGGALTGWLVYPYKSSKKHYRNFFLRQKSADLLLISATFLLIVYIGNALNRSGNLFVNPVQAISYIQPSASAEISPAAKAPASFSKKKIRQKMRSTISHWRKAYQHLPKSQKTGYVIAAVFIAVILSGGVSMLACNISCSGSEGLAIVVLILGFGGIIFGLIRLFRKWSREKTID